MSFYRENSAILYGGELIPVNLMTATALNNVIVDSLSDYDSTLYQFAKLDEQLALERERAKRSKRLKLISYAIVLAVAATAVVVAGTDAAAASAISSSTSASASTATALATAPSATIGTSTIGTSTASQASSLMREIKTVAKYVNTAASVAAKVSGSSTAARIADASNIIASPTLNDSITNTAKIILRKENFKVDNDSGLAALKEQIAREQSTYGEYLKNQSEVVAKKSPTNGGEISSISLLIPLFAAMLLT